MGKILIQEDCTICWHCLLVLPELLIVSIKSHYISMKERQMLQIKSQYNHLIDFLIKLITVNTLNTLAENSLKLQCFRVEFSSEQ